MKIFGLLFFFLLVLTSVSAQPFQSGTDSSRALTIIYPQDLYFEYNTNFSFHLHAVNGSNIPVMASDYSCIGHFYSSQNSHVLQLDSQDDSNGWDDFFSINTSLTSELGHHPFNIACNASNGEYGFVAGYFIVNYDGEDVVEANKSSWIMIIAVFIFVFMLLKVAFNIDEEHIMLKLLFTFFAVIVGFAGLNLGLQSLIQNLSSQVLINTATTIYRVGTIMFYLFSAYVSIYYIWKLFEWINENFIKRK